MEKEFTRVLIAYTLIIIKAFNAKFNSGNKTFPYKREFMLKSSCVSKCDFCLIRK